MKFVSVKSHMTQATQWDSAVKTAEMLFWANDNLTIGPATPNLGPYILPEFSIWIGIRNT